MSELARSTTSIGRKESRTVLRSVLRHSLVLGLVSAVLLLSASAAEGAGQWTKVVRGGFDNPNNSYFPDSAVFQGYLYVSTISSPAGIIYSGSHKLGAEILRSRDGASWQRVIKPGFGDRDNTAIRLAVFKNHLYAVADNSVKGFGIWGSSDGLKFRRLAAPGFGSSERNTAQPFVFGGRLLLGVSRSPAGAEIWASDDGASFREVVKGGLGDKNNTGVNVMRFNDGVVSRSEPVLNGMLYVGTSNPKDGGEVWRTRDGLSWERVADKGLGRGANIGLSPTVSFGGQVYVISAAYEGSNALGVDVYRSPDGKSWQKVVANGFNAGLHRNSLGFMSVFKDELYLVTSAQDARVLIPPRPNERFALHGFELRRSMDGVSWKRIGAEGFGTRTSFFAATEPSGDVLYLHATDYRNGGTAWRSSDGQRWTKIFHEPKASIFNEGLDGFPYSGHLLVFSNDLASGAAIWRSNFTVAGGRGSGVTTTTTTSKSTETTTATSTGGSSSVSTTEGGGNGGSSLMWLVVAGAAAVLIAGIAVFFGRKRVRGGAAAVGSDQSSAVTESSAAAAEGARFCAGCGKEFAEDARFCPHCGRPREAG